MFTTAAFYQEKTNISTILLLCFNSLKFVNEFTNKQHMKHTDYIMRISAFPCQLPSLFSFRTQFGGILYEMIIILSGFFLFNLVIVFGASIIFLVHAKNLDA